jgi:hypothetical protein
VLRTFGMSLAVAMFALTAAPMSVASPPTPEPAAQAVSGPAAPGQDLDLGGARATTAAKPGSPHARGLHRSDAAYGGLPEPASWLLMLIGVGMIGGALRGFVVANRALRKLQPDDAE